MEVPKKTFSIDSNQERSSNGSRR